MKQKTVDFTEEALRRLQLQCNKTGLTMASLIRLYVDNGLEAAGEGWTRPYEPLAAVAQPDAPGFVYVLAQVAPEAGRGQFKIGCSNDPLRRMAEIAKEGSLSLVLVCTIATARRRGLEAELHERFAAVRARRGWKREWFELSPSDLADLRRMAAEAA